MKEKKIWALPDGRHWCSHCQNYFPLEHFYVYDGHLECRTRKGYPAGHKGCSHCGGTYPKDGDHWVFHKGTLRCKKFLTQQFRAIKQALLDKASFEELVPRGSKYCSYCNGVFSKKDHFRPQIDDRKGRVTVRWHCRKEDSAYMKQYNQARD